MTHKKVNQHVGLVSLPVCMVHIYCVEASRKWSTCLLLVWSLQCTTGAGAAEVGPDFNMAHKWPLYCTMKFCGIIWKNICGVEVGIALFYPKPGLCAMAIMQGHTGEGVVRVWQLLPPPPFVVKNCRVCIRNKCACNTNLIIYTTPFARCGSISPQSVQVYGPTVSLPTKCNIPSLILTMFFSFPVSTTQSFSIPLHGFKKGQGVFSHLKSKFNMTVEKLH